MTGAEMLANMRRDLEDTDAQTYQFSDDFCYHKLNDAQVFVAGALVDEYLDELEYYDVLKTFTDGELALSNLTEDLLRSGAGIRRVILSNGRIANKMTGQDMKRTENYWFRSQARNPRFRIEQQKIKLLPATTDICTVVYLQVPDDISGTVDCTLSAGLHRLVVQVAVSMVWAVDDKPVRSTSAMNVALTQIQTLNAKYGNAPTPTVGQPENQ